MSEGQQNNNNITSPKDAKNASNSLNDVKEKKDVEEKKKLLIEEKQPKEQLPVGEGHETEVIEENEE